MIRIRYLLKSFYVQGQKLKIYTHIHVYIYIKQNTHTYIWKKNKKYLPPLLLVLEEMDRKTLAIISLFLGQFNLKDFLSHFQSQNIKSKFSEEMDHSSWVIRDPSLHLLFSHQATQIQFFFLPLALMARGNFRACFYYLLMAFVLWLQHYFGQVSPPWLPIPRWLLHVPESPIRGAPQ